MALAAQKALLDELMGKNRNACNGEQVSGPHWSDEDICKYYLCGFCPHELFVNTKTDLGPCPRTHDDRLRDSYKQSRRCTKMGYEEEFVQCLTQLIDDVDKRIRRGHDRLAVNKSVNNPEPITATEKKEKVVTLTKRINDLIKQAEELGTEGKVDQAQGVLKLCEQLKFERSQLEGDARPGMSKELEVCEICGAFRIKDDAPQRVEEHLTGKMHLGYAKIRDYLRQYTERKVSPVHRPSVRDSRSRLDRSPRQRERRPTEDNSIRSHSHGNHRGYPHRDDSDRYRSRHDNRNDKRRSDRSRSRSHRRSDRSRYEHSSRSSKRNTSPFSAARRPPEGAEDD